MTRIILRLAPAAALAALLTGCTGYAPPPMAQIDCEQQEPVDAGGSYLNCIRGWTAQQNAQTPTHAQATPAQAVQANGMAPTGPRG